MRQIRAAPARLGEGAHDVLRVLVRLLPSEKQEIRAGDAVLLGDPAAILFRDVRAEPRRHAVVDHLDARRRDPEVVHEVSLAVVRDRDDAVRAGERPPDHHAGVDERGTARQELRVQEVNDVVDRDDRAAAERRQDVVGRVEEVEAVPEESEGEARELRDRVAGGFLLDDLEVRGERRNRLAVRLPRVDAKPVVRRLRPHRDRLEQVADVGADPEVHELPGVHSDERGRAVHRSAPNAAAESAAAVRSAASFHVKSAARRRPASRKESRASSSSRKRSIAREKPAESRGAA